MTKTKQEIIDERSLAFYYPEGEPQVECDLSKVFEAMDEYAKIDAIEFADFLNMHKYEFETQSSEQLYELYQQSKTKQ